MMIPYDCVSDGRLLGGRINITGLGSHGQGFFVVFH